MLKKEIEKMKHEFGFNLNEDHDFEANVINQLDRTSKLDEIDTVSFGLETDDGKIVKVFVNAEEAEEFEKALADMLGKEDNIEEVLNALSSDFEIVDVEWPEEPEDKTSPEGEDGSDSMDKEVYNIKDPKENPKEDTEVDEADEGFTSISDRMTTAAQRLLYEVIISLGVPDIALSKSQYKTAIINGIKLKSMEVQENVNIKSALTIFLERNKNLVKTQDEKIEKDADKKDDAEEVKEDGEDTVLNESLVYDFWEGVTAIIKHAGKDRETDNLLDNMRFKALVSRSAVSIPSSVKVDLRMSLSRMSKALNRGQSKNQVNEALTEVELVGLLTSIFNLVDPSTDKRLSTSVTDTTAWRQYILSAKPTLSQKFRGQAGMRLREIQDILSKLSLKEEEEIINEWSYVADNDTLILKNIGFEYFLDKGTAEQVLNAILTGAAGVYQDSNANKFSISPRGGSLMLKRFGEEEVINMDKHEVENFTNRIRSFVNV